jgi:hypothetical protein
MNSSFAQNIIDLQHHYTAEWHVNDDAKRPSQQLDALVVDQHKQNFDLWHEEDKAREPNVQDSTIAQVKRNIDKLNQSRNDMITQIDELLADTLFNTSDDSLPWNSETIGSIIDRLSIASLKLFHMQEQVDREDASQEHKANCSVKVAQLKIQRDDLATALQVFHDDVLNGKKQNKLYRQFKMYNDPSLNPKIYNSDSGSS